MIDTIVGLFPSYSQRAANTADASSRRKAGAGTARRKRWPRTHVVDARLFRDVLLREHRRAERFDQPFVLVLLERKDGAAAREDAWAPVVEAVRASRRETDVLGWFDHGSVLGLLLPETDGADVTVTREIEHRVHRELLNRLSADAIAQYSVRLHVHLGQSSAAVQRSPEADALLQGLRVPRKGATFHSALKRLLDIAGSAVLLGILAPLFLIIAVAVKLRSPGPVFFRQVRIGESGQSFTMLKFRTMHVHADHAIHQQYVSEFIKSGASGNAAKDGLFKIVNDPRVTAVGRLLRKTSLDELPQLWNVLRGDMSLVGPRPPLPYEVEQYKLWHYRRVLEAKPGMTGLWQVTGRSRTSFDEMVRLDLRYARSHSAWTDIKILLATPRAVISGKGAC